MTDLSTANLKRLLDEAAPGPWERHPDNPRMLCNLERKFAVHAELTKGKGAAPQPEDVANTELIALAPQLAQEVLRMREELMDWANDEARAYNALVKQAQEIGRAGIVSTRRATYNRILEILGDHDA